MWSFLRYVMRKTKHRRQWSKRRTTRFKISNDVSYFITGDIYTSNGNWSSFALQRANHLSSMCRLRLDTSDPFYHRWSVSARHRARMNSRFNNLKLIWSSLSRSRRTKLWVYYTPVCGLILTCYCVAQDSRAYYLPGGQQEQKTIIIACWSQDMYAS